MLLMPQTPMLFQGQEFCASSPFLYFADHKADLADAVAEGRADFLSQFPGIRYTHSEFAMGMPHDRKTFESCKLDHSERRGNAQMVAFHKDLLALRREDPVFSAQRTDWLHGAVLGPEAFLLRCLGGVHGDRLIIVNLGLDLRLVPTPEPLLAPPEDCHWEVRWWSEDSRYGGTSRPPSGRLGGWNIPGHSAVVMHERPNAA
jgi:maltooligosyltrehalose trehalohydrolase